MDYSEKQKISLKIKEIIQNLQEEKTSWVNIANIGIHLSANRIDYKQFGYQKLRPFLELFEDMGFEIEENPKEIAKEVNGKTPVVYMRIKDKVVSETSCPDNEKTNKRGFFRIGYLQNKNTYAEDIRKISGVSYINYEELNSYVERQWENKENTVLCFNQSNEKVSGDREDISFIMIDTGYKKEGSGDSIYGKFTRKDPGSLTNNGWLGVVIGIESELLAPEAPDLNKYTHITREKYKFIARTLTEMTEGEAVYDCSGCENLLKESYIDAIKNDTLSEMKSDTNDGKAISFFPLGNGICNKDGERIYVKTEKNTNPNKQKWYGAFLISEEDLKMELLSYFCYHVGYFKFENSNQCNTFFDNLAEMAMKEKWDFNNSQKSGVPYSILRSYLEFTYYRLLDEDKKAEEKDKKIITHGGKCYFNSGLLDKHFRQIIIVGTYLDFCKEIKGIGKCSWRLVSDIHPLTQNDVAGIFQAHNLPKIASYFSDYRQVIFDASLDISLNDQHIFEDGISNGRLPKYKKDYDDVKDDANKRDMLLSRISRDFDSALVRTKLLAERNYKLAIPQFWKETGEIQFLLPIYLDEQEEYNVPQCALVISLDETQRVPFYRGKTILTLDMAYNNARLIAKPDIFWLNDLLQKDE